MGWTQRERMTLAVLGAVLLIGFGISLRQRQHPALVVSGAPSPMEAVQWDAALEAARQVDINTAGVTELERLPGVGPALAERIVEERQAHGPFSAPDELSRVAGIGPKTLEALREYVTTQDTTR